MEIVRKDRQARARVVVLILKCGHEVTLESYRGWEILCRECDIFEIRKRAATNKVYQAKLAKKKQEKLAPAY